LIQDETPEQPTDETPTPEEENVEPTTAPDEAPAEAAPEDVPSAESPADAPAEGDDITQVPEETPPQPDQAEGEPEDVPAEAGTAAASDAPGTGAEAEAGTSAGPETPGSEAPAEPAAAETEAAPEAATPPAERPRPRREEPKPAEPEVIPGAHLEPDLVLEQPTAETEGDEYAQYAEDVDEEVEVTPEPEAAPLRSPLELAADARYQATGKRKTAIARVILKPGSGVYTINGKTLVDYFPRQRLQTQARQPLDATGNLTRMDVVARIHGGGVSAQAGALRHGIARALVEAEPSLRTEMKRRGYLTRDPREKERKKAGLKKARKRPQFSKR
jgi:small subunit ribosomal protein S9